jgi:hypothetical protein
MKNKMSLALVSIALFASGQAAAEVWFQPRVDYGLTNYKQTSFVLEDFTDGGDSGVSQESEDVNVNLLTIGAGVTLGFSNFYVDFDMKTTQDSELHHYYSDIISFDGGASYIQDNGGIERDEMAITAGLATTWGSIFGGFKSSSTNMGHDLYFPDESLGNPAFEFIYGENTTPQPLVTESVYESEGAFAGVALGIPFTDSSNLVLNAAYALLSTAEYSNDLFGTQNKFVGDGQGFSASVKLTLNFLFVKAEYAKYEYDNYVFDDTDSIELGSALNEEFSCISAGITYQF